MTFVFVFYPPPPVWFNKGSLPSCHTPCSARPSARLSPGEGMRAWLCNEDRPQGLEEAARLIELSRPQPT